MSGRTPKKPIAYRLDDPRVSLADGEDGRTLGSGVLITPAVDPAAEEAGIAETSVVATRTAPRRSPIATLFWSSLTGLASLAFGVWAWSLVEDLFARLPALGWVGITLVALFALSVVVLLGREWLALRRLARIDRLRAQAEAAIEADDRAAADGVLASLDSLYAGDPRTARARAALKGHRAEIIDGADLVRLAERELMTPLDAAAQRLVSTAAKRVSVVTAIAPRAVLDVAVVAAVSVSMIRQIAGVYGGRPGTFGFLRLLRHVLSHLAVTGGMAAGEGLLEQLVGHGVAARISARLGEGVINGILTARVGLAAIAVCRPLPFAGRKAPTVRDVAGGLFTESDQAAGR